MLIIPAIDLKDGCVVRLVQGKLSDKTVYSKDPVEIAKHWVKQGAQFIHVVDLDGAFSGVPNNLEIAKEIAKSISIPIEFGGGVRRIDTIKVLIDAGVSRVVLGTKAVEDEDFLKKAFFEFKNKVIVSIDAKNGKALIKGWQDGQTEIDALDLAARLKSIGFKELVYTDISRDGTLSGPNFKGIEALLKAGLKIIASGGISDLEDLRKLKLMENDGVTGVIVGKALYEGKFTLSEAIKVS